MAEKLSERLPMQLSSEEGWKMDIVDLAHWLQELAQRVEALEPEDTDATIRKLYQALIRDRSEARIVIADLREELAKAKAEIERLKALISDLTAGITMCQADAEVGRLVRGMDKNTVLLRLPSGRFHTVRSSPDSKDFWNWDRAVGAICVADPAEALRAIQEVGDAEV